MISKIRTAVAEVRWLQKALDDLDSLNRWREEELGLSPISPVILALIEDQQFPVTYHT